MLKKKKMNIIYENKELLVVNKPAGLLTIATEKEKINTLYHQAREYLKKQNPRNKIFIVHRLDKDTSGLVIFAKNERMKKYLQNNWDNLVILREYIAIVEGNMEKQKGVLKSYLKENKQYKVYSTNNKEGNLAITSYEVLNKNKSFSLLKVIIQTGRKNQIRVQLSEINHPIVGDKKYGSLKNPLGRMCLHASKLILKINQQEYKWLAKIPQEFKIMFNDTIFKYESEENEWNAYKK